MHAGEVQGSPHFVLPDGYEVHNPGMSLRWLGKAGGFPVIDEDDPSVYDDLVNRRRLTPPATSVTSVP